MLRLRNVDVYYGSVPALTRVSLHVRQGEIVALVGGNGAGKTTTLTAASGLLRPKSGQITFQDQDITRLAPDRIVDMGLSQVPEGRLVWKPLPVEDNLLLGAFTRRGQTREVADDLDQIYSMFPILAERRRLPAGALSGGEQQMLAIGRALMARPRMLLLDEPSMGLAPAVTKEIFARIVALRQERGLTVLLVEQNARMALTIADRGYVLETGRVILQGPAGELLENRDVQRAYLGRDAGGDER
ncbi:ABC transporter related protein [Alkalidesulfovibrio alkalitolerans DSM 16529]|jgi:branched-chain amino acid transport system ATP-binding protein|uniref:ABC transporter related protein n=1 Tax=Alkalidesulfovibrio alkalitolerans DSM 16529 TaxID=1121439 RepID=S7TB59_9BACT|nr:ABC transporter ATP-binding protein [Alkalidesulfovibrio alkalitolerans]EPR34382.1 ABC transporter related protein [Alkalidesulfovibrio alkalitolerans DSM 16529]